MYDLIIIGAGPAGLNAALYAARKMLKVLVLTGDIGGQLAISGNVENYLGFKSIKGIDLVSRFEEHVKQYNVKIIGNDRVVRLKKIGKNFSIETEKEKKYESKSIIVTAGKKHRKLNVPGEDKLAKKGVVYCATCDAPLFKDKIVAVVGGGNSAVYAALALIPIAKKIYLITLNKKLVGEQIRIKKILASKKINVLYNSKTKEILGDNFVTGIKVEANRKEETISLDGVFVEVGYETDVSFIKDVKLNKWKEIIIDKENKTSILGLFAAGDATEVIFKQNIIAAGEGAKAALSAYEYLQK